MTADDAPWFRLSSPYSGIPVRTFDHGTATSTLSRVRSEHTANVLAHPADAEFFGAMLKKADDAESMRRKILSLCAELAIRTGEKKVLRDHSV